jgi:peptidoglycan/LPS O-acetylase OafA/YrhL
MPTVEAVTQKELFAFPARSHEATVRTSIQLDYIDGLRALTALYVVVHHTFQSWPGPVPQIQQVFAFGGEAVAVFITISGFCLALPQASRNVWTVDTRRFYFRRAWRILPPYYAAVAVGVAFALLRLTAGMPISSRTIWLHLLMMQNWSWNEMYTLIGPLWSVALECQIYLVFPLLVMLRRRTGIASMLIVGGLIGEGSSLLLHARGVTHLLIYFTFGIACAEWAFDQRSRVPMQMLIGIGVVLGWHFRYRGGHTQELASCIVSGALLAYLAQSDRSLIRSGLSWKPLAWVGLFSYSIYLVHGAFIENAHAFLAIHGLANMWLLRALITLAALLAIPASYAFHLLVERPFMSNTRQATEHRQEAANIQTAA